MLRFLAVAVAVVLVCGSAQAQRRVTVSSGGCANGACGLPSTSYFPSQPFAYSLPTSAAPVARTVGDGHTHTCPRCSTTWDHSTHPGHNCPKCGTAQFVQDSYRKPVGSPAAQVVPAPAAKVVPVAPAAGRSGSCDCGSACPCTLTVRERVPAGLVVTFVP